jgi:hypothetical protein
MDMELNSVLFSLGEILSDFDLKNIFHEESGPNSPDFKNRSNLNCQISMISSSK